MRLTSIHDGEDRSSRLRKALERAYLTHRSLTHPDVLHASQELDEEIVRVARAEKARNRAQTAQNND